MERSRYVDFSAPWGGHQFSIVIKNLNDVDNIFDPLMFWSPLATEVWILLIVLCLLPTVIISLQDVLLLQEKVSLQTFVLRLLSSFSSNFGGNFLGKDCKSIHRAAITCYFFNGLIIWIAFRSSIVAGLADKTPNMPFADLHSLAETQYYLSTADSGYESELFPNAPTGSIEQLVYANNMNNQSFVGRDSRERCGLSEGEVLPEWLFFFLFYVV